MWYSKETGSGRCWVGGGTRDKQRTNKSSAYILQYRAESHPQDSCAFPIYNVPEPRCATICTRERAAFVVRSCHIRDAPIVRQHDRRLPCGGFPHPGAAVLAAGDEQRAVFRQPPAPDRTAVTRAYMRGLPEYDVPHPCCAVLRYCDQDIPFLQHTHIPLRHEIFAHGNLLNRYLQPRNTHLIDPEIQTQRTDIQC